jgi:hypothetical protein
MDDGGGFWDWSEEVELLQRVLREGLCSSSIEESKLVRSLGSSTHLDQMDEDLEQVADLSPLQIGHALGKECSSFGTSVFGTRSGGFNHAEEEEGSPVELVIIEKERSSPRTCDTRQSQLHENARMDCVNAEAWSQSGVAGVSSPEALDSSCPAEEIPGCPSDGTGIDCRGPQVDLDCWPTADRATSEHTSRREKPHSSGPSQDDVVSNSVASGADCIEGDMSARALLPGPTPSLHNPHSVARMQDQCSLAAASRVWNSPLLFLLGLPLHLAGLIARPLLSAKPSRKALKLPRPHTPISAGLYPAKYAGQAGLKRFTSNLTELDRNPWFSRGSKQRKNRTLGREAANSSRTFATRSHFLEDLIAVDWPQDDSSQHSDEFSLPSPLLREERTEAGVSSHVEGFGDSDLIQLEGNVHAETPGLWQVNETGGPDPSGRLSMAKPAEADGSSLDTSADMSRQPHSNQEPQSSMKAERARPAQIEITEPAPLTMEDNQLLTPWEPDSFSLDYSPSNLSLDGSFAYDDAGSHGVQSPMTSRSNSSSDLEERGSHGDASSSTEESEG